MKWATFGSARDMLASHKSCFRIEIENNEEGTNALFCISVERIIHPTHVSDYHIKRNCNKVYDRQRYIMVL